MRGRSQEREGKDVNGRKIMQRKQSHGIKGTRGKINRGNKSRTVRMAKLGKGKQEQKIRDREFKTRTKK